MGSSRRKRLNKRGVEKRQKRYETRRRRENKKKGVLK
jgi:hypothetical protein